MGFEIAKRSPLWEGIVFPGIEGDDPRFEFFVATPRSSLNKYVSTAWLLKWNFSRGKELTFIRVPNPCIKVGARLGERTFEAYGPRTQGAFGKMSGSGATFGFDLAPGGFFPFSRKPASELANKSIAMEEILPGFPRPEWGTWSIQVANDWFRRAEDFLETVSPAESHLSHISDFFDQLWDKDETPSLDAVADQFGISKRSLQRTFLCEVGMSVRDAIRTTRLHKSLRVISRNDVSTLASIAMESGFFDQAHMIKEFNTLLKSSPSHVRKFL